MKKFLKIFVILALVVSFFAVLIVRDRYQTISTFHSRLTTEIHDPVNRSLSNALVFIDGDNFKSDLKVYDIDRNTEETLIHTTQRDNMYHLILSSDGKLAVRVRTWLYMTNLLFSTQVYATASTVDLSSDIYVVDFVNGKTKLMAKGLGEWDEFGWNKYNNLVYESDNSHRTSLDKGSETEETSDYDQDPAIDLSKVKGKLLSIRTGEFIDKGEMNPSKSVFAVKSFIYGYDESEKYYHDRYNRYINIYFLKDSPQHPKGSLVVAPIEFNKGIDFDWLDDKTLLLFGTNCKDLPDSESLELCTAKVYKLDVNTLAIETISPEISTNTYKNDSVFEEISVSPSKEYYVIKSTIKDTYIRLHEPFVTYKIFDKNGRAIKDIPGREFLWYKAN